MVNRGALASLVLATAVLSAGTLIAQQTTQPARDPQTHNVVRMMLDRSRLLHDVQFEVPVGIYRQYLRDISGRPAEAKAPVSFIAESGLYSLSIDKDHNVTLAAELLIRIFDPKAATNLPVLSAKLAWEDLMVDGKPAAMATTDGFLRWSPGKAGVYTITAKALLPKAPAMGERLALAVLQTTRTQIAFESPAAWQVQPDLAPIHEQAQAKQSSEVELGQIKLIGSADKGTHGRLTLPPVNQIAVRYFPPTVQTARASRYELSGDIAWNIDTAAQQVTADLKVAVGGGASDQFELLLGDGADRVAVTGPEVQQVQVASGKAVVFLRGKVLGATPIKLSYELPLGSGAQRSLGRLGITDGHWSGGTLVVTNTAGGSEVLPATASGLTEMSPFEIPDSAKALLAGPAVMAYQVTSRQFEATVEVLQLGQFALRQSLADLAHFETFMDRDGSVIGRARYEIRNRNKQFLRVNMPAAATVLLARVNEKSVPLTPVAGKDGQYLLKLERSLPSVKGLVSFPVEIVYTARVNAIKQSGTADIPLPAIDLPIAYAWCQSYLPDGVEIRSVAGPMKRVNQFSSQTAKASLDYGYGTMAEGYAQTARPMAAAAPQVTPAKTLTGPARLTLFNGQKTQMAVSIVTVPDGGTTLTGGQKTVPSATGFGGMSSLSATPHATPAGSAGDRVSTEEINAGLARNYYRAGKDYYDKGDYDNAARSLSNTVKLAQGSVEAENADRLLANIKTLKGDTSVTGKTGSAQKAAVREVQQRATEKTRGLEKKQEMLVEQAMSEARAGKAGAARNTLQAAQGINAQINLSNAANFEAQAQGKEIAEKLKEIRKIDQAETDRLTGQMDQLAAAGQYDQAVEVANTIRLKGGGTPELQKKLDAIVIAQARNDRQSSAWGRGKPSEQIGIIQGGGGDDSHLGRLAKISLADSNMAMADESARAKQPVVKAYDVSDLVLNKMSVGGIPLDDVQVDFILKATGQQATQQTTRQIIDTIRQAVGEDSWQKTGGDIREANGRLVITQTAENHRMIADVLAKLRQVRGPQVQIDSNITQQRASGHLEMEGGLSTLSHIQTNDQSVTNEGLANTNQALQNPQLRKFVADNYGWTFTSSSSQRMKQPSDSEKDKEAQLIQKLQSNLWQKVAVNSVNFNVSLAVAQRAGMRFNSGGNLQWITIDEAQFRTLLELDAQATADGSATVPPNDRLQETIVGTEALLANEMTANLSFAAERSNVLTINGNSLSLPHESYLLINNGGYLTAVRAAAMQHWTTPVTEAFLKKFAQIPQTIDVPRVGQLVNLEKTLLESNDLLVIKAEYAPKGTSK